MQSIKTSLSIFTAVYCLFCTTLVEAVEEIGVQIGSIQFEQFNTQDIKIDFGLAETGLTFSLSTPAIELAKPIGIVRDLKLHCTKLKLFSEHMQCQKGSLQFKHQQLGKQSIYFAVNAQPNAEYYQLSLSNVKFADANFSATLKLHHNNWQLTTNSAEISLAALLSTASAYLTEQQIQQLSEWDIAGKANLAIVANGIADQLNKAIIDVDLHDLALSETTGRYVSEAIGAKLHATIGQQKQRLDWNTELHLHTGQAYAEPIFIDFSETVASVASKGFFNNQTEVVSIEQLQVQHADILTASANYQGNMDFSGDFSLQLVKTDFNRLFQHWLQPFLYDAGLAELEIAGDVSATINKQQDSFSLQTNLYDVYIDDQQNRFGLYQLNGNLGWTNREQPINSSLQWQGGYLFQLPLGHTSLKAQVQQQRFRLTETMKLPLLDGAIEVEQFELFKPQQGEMEWSFKAELQPISMTDLTSSFGWPTMSGKLSGRIPKVSYSNHQIDIDGALEVNLFDGATVIKDLRLSEPFGSLPQLYANIELKNIDLETLTRTFDFGKITGKLDGQIYDLRLANWQPVAFDATFYTPKGDESRRRISQQAVNNLSEVSGGASALLSRSFLRFFENFSYKQLGLSCKLVNDVCEMDGVKAGQTGYYIVEGGGMPPQINVMGFTRRVNWPELLARLKAVSNADGVIVE